MIKKRDEIFSKALLARSPEEAMKILRDAGMFASMQCHGYATNTVDISLKIQDRYNKKWWQFWK